MKLQPALLEGIEHFLKSTPPKIVKRGRGYFARGDVVELECVNPQNLYRAVVRGGIDYEVGLEFAGGEWAGQCSCHLQADCRHIVAALMELREQASGNGSPPVSGKERLIEAAKHIPQQARRAVVLQPPSSPVCDKLVQNLGRALQAKEAEFIKRVQACYASARGRGVFETELMSMAAGPAASLFYSYWQPLELWGEFPRDDFEFWLFVAWELRRRQAAWPQFMDGITDLRLIEPAILAWERKQEVAKWKSWFSQFEARGPAADLGTLELRLALGPTEARLQFRTASNAEFTELKQAQAKRLAQQFDKGELEVAPDSLALWGATYKPWSYESWWKFKYDDATARPALNRLLRLPLPPDRVVTAGGQPLARTAEALRLELRPPQNGDDSYELALVTPNASRPPRILCTLHGQPTLYLTEGGLFKGPPSDALDRHLSKRIPSAALETSEGLRFLHAAGVPLPDHLQQRIRTVPVKVTISCCVKPLSRGSATEAITITVTATAPGMPKEKLAPRGWEPFSNYQAQKTLKPGNGVLTIYDRQAQQAFPRLLEPLGLKWEYYPGEWKLRLTRKTPELFVSWLKSVPPEIEVKLDAELATLRDEPLSGTVSLDVSEAGIDWFDLKVALQVSDTTLTPEELKLLLNARGGYVRLGKKGWRRLHFNLSQEEDEQLARLGLNPRDFSAEPQRFHALQLADEAAKRFLGPERVELIQRRVRDLQTRVVPPLPPAIRAQMRPYQTEGFHFLAYLTSNRFGGVLADDMGLGKTLQTLAWLAWLREESKAQSPKSKVGKAPPTVHSPQSTVHGLQSTAGEKEKSEVQNPGTGNGQTGQSEAQKAVARNGENGQNGSAPACVPSLVVCPKSVMDNWRGEAERFYPDLRVRLWQGDPASELAAAREGADLVVVNYAQLRSLSPDIANFTWMAAVLDEAQYIKNPDSQTAQAARALNAGQRLALTGTPIENRLLDLWSIIGFAMPGALGNRTHFLRRFDAKDDPLARRRLTARVRPFLLRRTKAQVAQDLPDRVEEDLLCEMEGSQRTLYQAELKRARQIILGLTTNQQLNRERFNILTSLLRLRQICCHPALVNADLREAESAKLEALEDLLEPLVEEGHKVLVFSQFVTMLDLLRATVKKRKWPFFYLAGDTEHRGKLVEDFQTSKDGAVFLLSLKAGGFGLNLTAASYVVLYDPWWNPAVEKQAIDRTHRIGQTSKVIAYRLLMRDSIEQKIRLLQQQKAALFQDVLGEERFAQGLTLEDLRILFAE